MTSCMNAIQICCRIMSNLRMTSWSSIHKPITIVFKKIIFNFAFLFIATIAVSGQNAGASSSSEKVYVDRSGNLTGKTIRRNLKRFHYDDGGAFLCDSIMYRLAKGKRDPCDHIKLRDFIWDYWSNK